MLSYKTVLLALLLSSSSLALPIRREVPQEHSHQAILTSVQSSLVLNNPDNILDSVFGLLGNEAAAAGLGEITDVNCLQQATADQAFTNAKAAGDVQGQTNALIYRALERNTATVGGVSAACTSITAVNPEIAAIQQHQDPASPNAAAGNKAIALELAKQIASIGGNPQDALQSGTFKPGNLDDNTGKGNTCDVATDPVGCIISQNLLVPVSSIGNFGKCSVPQIEFAVGFDNRKETSFQPVDQVSYNHGSADNIAIITQFMCDTLVNTCGADATAQATCAAAQAAAAAQTPKEGIDADAFNGVFGIATNFRNVEAVDDQGNPIAGSTGGSVTVATVGAAEAGAAPVSRAAASGTNVQTFTGALGGITAPPVLTGGAKGFVTDNSDFIQKAAAITRSCSVQHNACATAANSGQAFTVAQFCSEQNDTQSPTEASSMVVMVGREPEQTSGCGLTELGCPSFPESRGHEDPRKYSRKYDPKISKFGP
ncbi:hypothetical protein K438DRAFT_1930422 [Mycena galopus ATCC 62051]|nr:hypothetical protein K438DRAFT_1930422 [Mycena galopus ATCC 62051]